MILKWIFKEETMNYVSRQTLERLPVYLRFLQSQSKNGPLNTSAKAIAETLGLTEIQVRKDLAAISDCGKPRIGYIINDLISDLEEFLGYKDVNDAIIVGAGKLGKALMSYKGFADYGLNIVAAFDTSVDVVGKEEEGKPIFHIDKLEDLCRRMNIRIGIITAPAEHAQSIADKMVKSGILAIWNFAPAHIEVPSEVLVKNENMAASLAVLSKHLSEQLMNIQILHK